MLKYSEWSLFSLMRDRGVLSMAGGWKEIRLTWPPAPLFHDSMGSTGTNEDQIQSLQPWRNGENLDLLCLALGLGEQCDLTPLEVLLSIPIPGTLPAQPTHLQDRARPVLALQDPVRVPSSRSFTSNPFLEWQLPALEWSFASPSADSISRTSSLLWPFPRCLECF